MLYYSTCSFGSKRHAWGRRELTSPIARSHVSALPRTWNYCYYPYNLFRSFTEKSFPILCSFPFFQKLVPPYQKHVPWWRLLKLFCVADILVYLYVVLSFSFGVMSLSSAIFIVIGNVFLTSTPWLLYIYTWFIICTWVSGTASTQRHFHLIMGPKHDSLSVSGFIILQYKSYRSFYRVVCELTAHINLPTPWQARRCFDNRKHCRQFLIGTHSLLLSLLMNLSKWNGWKGFYCWVKNYFSRPFEQREEGFTMTGRQFTTKGTCCIVHLADLFYNTFRNILGERKCSPWHSLLLIIVSERAHFECRRHANNQQERVKDYIHGYNTCIFHCSIKWKGHWGPWCGKNHDSHGAIASCITLEFLLSPTWCTLALKCIGSDCPFTLKCLVVVIALYCGTES